MRHVGQARQAAIRIIVRTLVLLILVCGGGWLAAVPGSLIASAGLFLLMLWGLFVVFTLYFFRDPDPNVPQASHAIVSPAHGKVDVIDEIEEPLFMGGRCRRVSIFLSIFDVHVQYAPAAGRITFFKHTAGLFLNALRTESAIHNENILLGIESSERPDEKIGVRAIAGVLARRIVPWVAQGDLVARGERTSLIQFGSRCDLYLPLSAQIQIRIGDHVVGGETIVANRS